MTALVAPGASTTPSVRNATGSGEGETKSPLYHNLYSPSDENQPMNRRRRRSESASGRVDSLSGISSVNEAREKEEGRRDHLLGSHSSSSDESFSSPNSVSSPSAASSPHGDAYKYAIGRSRAESIEHNSRFIHGGGGDKSVMTQVIMAEKTIGWLRKIYWIGSLLFVLLALEYCREAYGRGTLTYSDILRDIPSRVVTTYLILSLALWVFRNDFPFNLVILIVCAFCAGRFSNSVELESLVTEAVHAAQIVAKGAKVVSSDNVETPLPTGDL